MQTTALRPKTVSVIVDEATGNDGQQCPTLEPCRIEGGIFGFGAQRFRLDHPRPVEIDQHEIGRRAFGEALRCQA